MTARLDARVAAAPIAHLPLHEAWALPVGSMTSPLGASQSAPAVAMTAQTRTLPHAAGDASVTDFARRQRIRSVQPAAMSPESSPTLSNRSVSRSGSTLQLAQEVSGREAELQALRAEVVAKEEETAKLHYRLRDVHFKLQKAAGTLDTLSVKVETVAGNRQSVLRASAQHIDAHVDTLQRWLARMEWQLIEKDEEIAALQKATESDRDVMFSQQDELNGFFRREEDNEATVKRLQEESLRARRHQAITSWCTQVKAHIDRENADIVVQREQRLISNQLLETCEMNRWLQAFILRLEDKCEHLARELQGEGKVRDTLCMQERLSETAAHQGHDYADQFLSNAKSEFQDLVDQLQQESARRASAAHLANAYDQQEVSMLQQQTELMALTACLREVTRTLRDQSGSAVDDLIEAEIAMAVESFQDYGATAPPLLRVSPNEYLIGSDIVRCSMVAGKAFVQAPGILPSDRGALVPIGDYLRNNAHYPPMATSVLTSTAGMVSLPPRPKANSLGLPQLAPPLFGPSPAEAARKQGLPAVMAPLVIGGAESLLAT